MKMNEIKAAIAAKAGINLPTLMLVRQKDAAGVSQPWLSHWDNDKRVRITLHEDTAKAVQADPNLDKLAFKSEVVAAHENVAEYTRFVIITPTSVEITF